MIIDFHTHLGQGIPGTASVLQRNITPEMIIGPAEEAGVSMSCVYPVTYRPEDYEAACREIADAVARYPDKLIGFARLAMTSDAASILERAVRDMGLKGLKLHHGLDRFGLLDTTVHELLEKAGELGVPVVFHSIGAMRELEKLARDHPHTAIVFGHAGGMWNCQDIERCGGLAAELPNVYFDTSAVLVTASLRKAILRAPDRALLGSDAPAMHPHVEIEKIRILHLPPEVEAKALGANAARLLGLEGGSQPLQSRSQHL